MIDLASPARSQVMEPPAPLPSGPDRRWGRETAGRQKQVRPNYPPLVSRLDRTMHVYTRMRDPETDRVLTSLPAAHRGKDTQKPAGTIVAA